MDQANGNVNGKDESASVTPLGASASASTSQTTAQTTAQAAMAPGMAQRPGAGATPHAPGAAHRPTMLAPHHVHGSILEGGDSPSVLAQPAATERAGQGSAYHPDARAERAARAAKAAKRARHALSEAQWAVSARYRRVSDHTDDYVHDNPWKSIGLAAIGGLLIGLLVSR
jgi:ElaB/YqjD/DUF883 family membrane-anchored ribosome-binding protein